MIQMNVQTESLEAQNLQNKMNLTYSKKGIELSGKLIIKRTYS